MKVWSKQELRKLRTKSVAWYRDHKRDLPWRKTNDAYSVWVSEIMLQQTQVATVIPYFHRFMEEFPTVADLASAEEERVLFHWAGLGYYRRAKQMHAAAKLIVAKRGGVFPSGYDQILSLPGIGRYTAGAIRSFAFDLPSPIVEANTQRIYARLLKLKGQLTDTKIQSELWNFATAILPTKTGSGDTNQAFMEIGSQICLPKNPRCLVCPLRGMCPTYESGEQSEIPSPKPAKIYEDRTEAALLINHAKKGYLVRFCLPGERWAGLWDFPRFDVSILVAGESIEESLAAQFFSRYELELEVRSLLSSIKHGVTKYRITLHCFEAALSPKSRPDKVGLVWRTSEELATLPLSSTGRRLCKQLT
jgi:A/G-specific adenine glycosylase